MSEEKAPDPISAIIKPITDITVSVGAVMAYIQGIFKIAETPIPNTFSLLLILSTSVIVISRRWGKLHEKKKNSTKNGTPKTAAKGSFFERLLEPLKESKRDPYALSLPRRRVEAGFIAALTVFTLGWSGVNASAVVTELTTDPSLACSYAEGKDNLLIYVANVQETGGQKILIADRIYEALVDNQQGNQFDVCRLKETFEVNTTALAKAKENEVDIILWGRKDTWLEIHIETPLFSDPDRIIYKAEAEVTEAREFVVSEPLNIAYIVEFTLSEVLVLKDRMPESQTRLRSAIYRAEEEAIKDPKMALDPKDLADGHYLLGLFYAPHFSSAPNEEKAIQEYSAAIDINKNMYVARLNRGFLLMDMGRIDEAKADFDYLIENENPYKGLACLNRADLQTDPELMMSDLDCAVQFDPQDGYYFRGIKYMDLGEYSKAIADLEKAVEYGTGGFDNYYFLGLAQLYAGKHNAAKETFNIMFPLVEDEETRDALITDLQDRAKKNPEIEAVANEAIQSLQAIKIP